MHTTVDYSSPVFAVLAHPERSLFLTATLTGHIFLSQPGIKEPLWKTKRHGRPCRGLDFDPGAIRFASVGADKVIKIAEFESGKVIWKDDKSLTELNAVSWLNENIIVTGDDKGTLQVWDTRIEREARSRQIHDDYISSITPISSDHFICTSYFVSCHCVTNSGDATLSHNSVRTTFTTSEDQEPQLLSSVYLNSQLYCGTDDGVLLVFHHDQYANQKLRISVTPDQDIDCLALLDSDKIVVGQSNGGIEIIQGQSIMGHIGQCEDGVTCISTLSDGRVITGAGSQVQTWSVDLENLSRKKKRQKKGIYTEDLFFAGLE